MEFLKCVCYLAVTGIAAFFAGRIVPKKWFRADAFPYKSYPFEKEGKIYDKLRIRSWQSRVPDMSRILPGLIPAKKMTADYQSRLPQMIQETCVAEMTHFLLCLTGLYCLVLWPGAGGVVLTLLYIVLGNLPFILIQRYNRPRFLKLWRRERRKAAGNPAERVMDNDAVFDIELQYGRGT